MFLEPVVRKCVKGHVYEKPLEDEWNRKVKFQRNNDTICCAKNELEFDYQNLSSEADYDCCAG